MKKILGWILLTFVIIFLFICTAISHGFLLALIGWGIAIGLAYLIWIAIWLITE